MAKRKSRTNDIPPDEPRSPDESADQPQEVNPDVSDDAERTLNINEQSDQAGDESHPSRDGSPEDLGTVPDEMRHAMAERAVYSYKVLLFEKHGDGRFRRPEEYVRRAIATVTTHDLPTLRGYWEGGDLELRDRLSLFPGEEIRRYVIDERVCDRAQLLAALDAVDLRPADCPGPDAAFTDSLARAVHLYLARSAAALVVLQVEDLMGMADPVNVPGTSHEHDNWRRKVTESLEDLFTRESVGTLFRDMQQARSG